MDIDLAKPPMSPHELAAARSDLDAQLRWEKRIYQMVLTVLGLIVVAFGVARFGMLFNGEYGRYLVGATSAFAGFAGLCIAADLRHGCLQMKRDALNTTRDCGVLQALCKKHPKLAEYRQAVHATGRSMTLTETQAFWNWSREVQEQPSTVADRSRKTIKATTLFMRQSSKRPPAC